MVLRVNVANEFFTATPPPLVQGASVLLIELSAMTFPSSVADEEFTCTPPPIRRPVLLVIVFCFNVKEGQFDTLTPPPLSPAELPLMVLPVSVAEQ